MSDATSPHHAKRAAQAAAVIAAIAVVIVLDPIGHVVGMIDFSWISLPEMPGFVKWIHDLPGPGFLIIVFVLMALGEAGRRRRHADDDA